MMRYKSFLVVLFLTMQFGWAQKKDIAQDLISKVEQVSNDIKVGAPNPMDPLALNATIVWSNDKSQLAVVIKATLLEGWHIYAYVPETQPYINTELRLELPKGISSIGDWEMPYNTPYEKGIYVYEETLVFVQYCTVNSFNEEAIISAGLYYQTCDQHKCFPPTTKTKRLSL